ncbi:hypothetical protein YC2023_027450 [Brassica napus]
MSSWLRDIEVGGAPVGERAVSAGGSPVGESGVSVVAGGVPVEESSPSRESKKPVAEVAIFEIQRDGSSIWR